MLVRKIVTKLFFIRSTNILCSSGVNLGRFCLYKYYVLNAIHCTGTSNHQAPALIDSFSFNNPGVSEQKYILPTVHVLSELH